MHQMHTNRYIKKCLKVVPCLLKVCFSACVLDRWGWGVHLHEQSHRHQPESSAYRPRWDGKGPLNSNTETSWNLLELWSFLRNSVSRDLSETWQGNEQTWRIPVPLLSFLSILSLCPGLVLAGLNSFHLLSEAPVLFSAQWPVAVTIRGCGKALNPP